MIRRSTPPLPHAAALVAAACLASGAAAHAADGTDQVRAALAPQRAAVLALAPFVLDFEVERPGSDAPARAGSLLAAADGRFTVHLQAPAAPGREATRESRAWDGNGLYLGASHLSSTFFLPAAAFPDVLDRAVDAAVERRVPMADLTQAVSLGGRPSGASIAIQVPPLMAFDYLMTLDRFASASPARQNLRWCDVASDPLFARATGCLRVAEHDAASGRIVLRTEASESLPFRGGVAIDQRIECQPPAKGAPAGAPPVVTRVVLGGPWEAVIDGPAISAADFARASATRRTTVTFVYRADVAGGVLPAQVEEQVTSPPPADAPDAGAKPVTAIVRRCRVTRFQRLDQAEADEAIDQYSLLQPALTDVTALPAWRERRQSASAPAASATAASPSR